eukprot:CAMPEP_0119312046 /NCGR_PEP_ID=MMETSP1333-20130426/24813_1 /TAXON_ID=418940 /ORGANISM="Scyphosphaera apsteinii, Strain RCC1455" /LENGTH=106 /DNA_ID=CAMNT_0007316587 /DNA_START=36 /DNA_END=356 /DNA_ORIENTATION=+
MNDTLVTPNETEPESVTTCNENEATASTDDAKKEQANKNTACALTPLNSSPTPHPSAVTTEKEHEGVDVQNGHTKDHVVNEKTDESPPKKQRVGEDMDPQPAALPA